MTTLPGGSSWLLHVRREGEGLTVERAVSLDAVAVLPERLLGLPVTALGDRAFSPSPAPSGGEELRITGPARPEGKDNAGLRELTLPPTLERVGDYALAGCRALETLRLADVSVRWGAAVFMNCAALGRFLLEQPEGREGDTLAYLAGELNGTMDVTLRRRGSTYARLIFPEYAERYEVNGAAHIFNYRVYGVGYPYHHVFRNRRLELRDYDALWAKSAASGEEDGELLALAWWRLRWPAGLEPEAAAAYRDWLRPRWERLMDFLLRQQDSAGLGLCLDALAPSAEMLRSACALSRKAENTEATALLLEALHRQGGAGQTDRAEAFVL